MPKAKRYRTHLVIPDTQVKPGVPTEHIRAAGNYAAEKRPDVIVVIGDFWDFPSLSSYDSTARKVQEEVDFTEDIEAGNDAMADFLRPIRKKRSYKPRLVFNFGNHENRRVRYVEEHPEARKALADERLNLGEFERHRFLKPVIIDGISYCHFYCPDSNGRVMNSKRGQASAKAQVNNVGMSATAGHKQGLDVHIKECQGGRRRGIIAGSFYQHDEDYLSEQGNAHWNGILHKFEVNKGNYDLLEISLDFLLDRYS